MSRTNNDQIFVKLVFDATFAQSLCLLENIKTIRTMKNLIKIFSVFVFSISMTMAFGQSTRNVANFTKISASSNVQVKLIKADQQSISFKMLSGDEKNLITEVKNGRLKVKIKSGMLNWGNKSKAAVKVYYTELTDIDVSAGASVKAEDLIYATNMDVEVSSGAIADLEIQATNLEADASSGARLILEGSSKGGNFEVSSGANIDASNMVCDNVSADASSGGHLEVHANKKLNAEASSGGSIRYLGDVEYTNTDSGWSGQIKRIR